MHITQEVMVIASLMVVAVLFLMTMFARLYRKAGPHQALVVYGVRGTRIIKGRGTVIFPMVETYRELSLQLMSFDVAPQQDLYTMQGVAVTVEAVSQIKVKSDPESIITASEQFLTKSDTQREGLIRLVMEGHLRGIIGQLTVEEIVKQPEMVGDRMRGTCAGDMDKMGLEVISFTIKEVRDKNDYITNMGRPDVARIKRDADKATAEAIRDADIAIAEAERDTAIKRAEAKRESAIATTNADQARVLAETLSQAKQAEATRDLDVKRASYLESVKRQQAQADKTYDIQTSIMQQQLIAESVKVEQIEKEAQIKVQEAEIQRRERELIATVLKSAEVERRRIETLAEAEKQRRIFEAEGRASAIRAEGEADQEWNEAAVVDKLITNMPEVVRALASPLANVDKITIVSTGNGDNAGMSKITGDMAAMAAQIPALFETLSGMKMSELLGKVQTIKEKKAGD